MIHIYFLTIFKLLLFYCFYYNIENMNIFKITNEIGFRFLPTLNTFLSLFIFDKPSDKYENVKFI